MKDVSNGNSFDDNVSSISNNVLKSNDWMQINWRNTSLNQTKHFQNTMKDHVYKLSDSETYQAVFSPESPSPVQLVLVRDRLVYIKRDDLLHLRHSNVSGNKARKMFALNELSVEEFPDVIVSYGGPQSNAMLSLAAIVNAKDRHALEKINGSFNQFEESQDNVVIDDRWMGLEDNMELDQYQDSERDTDDDSMDLSKSKETASRFKRFIYYTKKLPRYLRNQPNGNLLRALSLGMELKEVSHDEYKILFGGEEGGSANAPTGLEPPVPLKSMWVPQGGACGVAEAGAKIMAMEIVEFWSQKGRDMPLTVVLPGGTCTTAMFLAREINVIRKLTHPELDILVAVIPCVGDATYSKRQMVALDISTGGNGVDDIPQIIQPLGKGYLRFGEPSKAILNTFIEMKDEYGIFLDLLYGAPAWTLLLRYLRNDINSPIFGRQVMYVHSGGLEGISSQMTRYKHKGLLEANQIQN
jgi:1-aminocyclopropane-1-carboxylate deaminase/D-cysteine desulfhydrase-like pyridoxal-dependent ACC family enzyme